MRKTARFQLQTCGFPSILPFVKKYLCYQQARNVEIFSLVAENWKTDLLPLETHIMQVNFGENDIKDLLTKVKIFNASIGDYQLYTVNEHFSYFVKLSNGSIILTIDDLIANKDQTLTPEHLQALAGKFNGLVEQSATSSNTHSASKVETYSTPSPKKKRSPLRILSIILGSLLLLGVAIALIIQNFFPELLNTNPTYYSDEIVTGTYQQEEQQPPKTEAELKAELFEKEKSHPEKYLYWQITTREKFLLDQQIFEGDIRNNAKLCSFKNMRIKISALAKTGYVLESREFIITEFVKPFELTTFELRTKSWDSRTVDFNYEIVSAEGY